MTDLKREATIRWLDHPPGGTPRMTVGSESLTPSLPLSVDRHAAHPLAASPGELLAGAIGATFAWLTAERLLSEGTQARAVQIEQLLHALYRAESDTGNWIWNGCRETVNADLQR